MNNAELDIAIKANADQLLSTINKVTARLDDLSNKINSLPAGDKQLNKLSREFARTSVTQQKLINQFDNLGTEVSNTAPKIEQAGNASKSARTALTSLSLTIQDLPFGFLGIQNNLPGVIQGFGNLTTTTNGKVLPALKEIGKSLIGPAGIFLAFSAVTSILTVIIQKYGSLGNALNALLGKQTEYNIKLQDQLKLLDEYNKKQQSTERIINEAAASQKGQIAVINSLVKAFINENSSLKEKEGALSQLKDISNDYFGTLKIGAGDVDKIREAAEKYTKVLIAQAKIKALSNQIDDAQKLVVANEELLQGSQENTKTYEKQYQVNKALFPVLYKIRAFTTLLNKDISDSKDATNKLANSIFDLNNKSQGYQDAIDAINKELIANITTTDGAAKSVKAYFESYKPTKEYIDFFKDISTKGKYDAGVELFNQLSNLDLSKGINSVKKFNEILGNIKDQFPNISLGIVSTPAELANAFSNLRNVLGEQLRGMEQDIVDAEINKRLTTQFYDSYDFVKETLKNIREEWKKTKNYIGEPILPSTENIIGLGPATMEKAMAPLLQMNKDMMKAREDFLRNFRDVSGILNDVFFQPLQEQFTNLIKNGKISLREFSNMVVENMKALAAKILATGIITLIGMLLTGGLSEATQLKTGLTGFQLFGKAFAGALGFGGTRSANFGGVGPGGLAMSGAVSLSLRGSDLVGAINRTNTNINRIG